jgi:CHASE3 domain sensor protein
MENIEIEAILFLAGLIVIMLGTALVRVWKIPEIDTKLDNVIRETEKNRNKIHNINNTLHHHETRITLLEKSKDQATKP